MSLTKNIGIGKEKFDFRYGVDFKSVDTTTLKEDWRKKGIWPTQEEVFEAIELFDVQKVRLYLSCSLGRLSIDIQFFTKSQFDKDLLVNYTNMLMIQEHRISINAAADKYVERLKTFGYEVAFRDEQNRYIMYGPSK